MSRQGVTATEEKKLAKLIAEGKSWDHVVAHCQTTDTNGNPVHPLLDGVDLAHVKKFIWDPLKKAHDAAQKSAGTDDLLGKPKK
jgi:hypothetical protein